MVIDSSKTAIYKEYEVMKEFTLYYWLQRFQRTYIFFIDTILMRAYSVDVHLKKRLSGDYKTSPNGGVFVREYTTKVKASLPNLEWSISTPLAFRASVCLMVGHR